MHYNHEQLPFSHQDMLGEARLSPEAQAIFDEVAVLDPELLETPETRRLVEIGAAYILEVSGRYGSPAVPRWQRGSVDETIMTYHNGESEGSHGHTSVGADGVGVPRGVLVIAAGINARAGYEVVGRQQRALLFAAATAHDVVQLCGRSVAVANGDEEQSANRLRSTLQQSGFSEAIAAEGACYVEASKYDPTKGQQVIIEDGMPFQTVLGQQILAAADLLSPATRRGALGSMEWTLEESGLGSKDRVLQTALAEAGLEPADVPDLATLHAFVDAAPQLKARFAASLRGQAGWIEGLRYTDSAIRAVCGAGIDDMFPGGRMQTAANLRMVADLADRGVAMASLWQVASDLAR
ncbi:MAG TPA: hypothetical protein VLF40_00520 [Candidatus Saccharimonadales bacterium]|nr:hypothetical protein [Candidatus Saccharimonadales bacterium]